MNMNHQSNQNTNNHVETQRLKHNIIKDYFFTFFYRMDLTQGVWMIYLAAKGLSLTALGLLEMIFHVTSFFMEVPTGAVADFYGRKTSRIMGRILFIISVLILWQSDSYLFYIVSFVMMAISYNLESGAGTALVYDSLIEIKEEDSYMKISGRNEMFMQAASVGALLLGGYLASHNYSMVFAMTMILSGVALLIGMTFKEPSVGTIEMKSIGVFFTQIKESALMIRNNPKLSFLIFFSQFLMAVSTCVFYYLQNYMTNLGYDEAGIGTLYAVSSLIIIFIAPLTYRLEALLKPQGMLKLMPFVSAVGLWGLAEGHGFMVFFVILMILESVSYITVNDYINKEIPSDKRATLLSMGSMIFSLMMVLLFPLFGLIGDHFGIPMAIVGLASLMTLFAFINLKVVK